MGGSLRSRVGLGCLSVVLATSCGPGARDTEPLAYADSAGLYAARLMEDLGGQKAWDEARYVSFRWLVERNGETVANREHAWDRYEGRYRLSYEQGGAAHLMIFDIDEPRVDPVVGKVPAGGVWIDGQPLPAAARDSALSRGFRVFINDTYWALMPFKWGDPGVHLTYEGRRTLSDGREYATIHLTFDPGLGVTEDQYWAFLEPASGHMAAWQFHLGGSEAPGDLIWWEDWSSVGAIRFAMTRRGDDGALGVFFRDVVANPTVPAGRFDPPLP